jgi:hypothetical protein
MTKPAIRECAGARTRHAEFTTMSQLMLVMQQGRRRLLDRGNCARYALQAPDRRLVALFSRDFNIRCDDLAGFRSVFADQSSRLTISVGELL